MLPSQLNHQSDTYVSCLHLRLFILNVIDSIADGGAVDYAAFLWTWQLASIREEIVPLIRTAHICHSERRLATQGARQVEDPRHSVLCHANSGSPQDIPTEVQYSRLDIFGSENWIPEAE